MPLSETMVCLLGILQELDTSSEFIRVLWSELLAKFGSLQTFEPIWHRSDLGICGCLDCRTQFLGRGVLLQSAVEAIIAVVRI